MILEVCVILLGVIVAGTIINAFEEYGNKKYNISFKESMDLTELPVITFYNNGKKVNFLLDTGSTQSIINTGNLKGLKYKDTNITTDVFGMEGNVQTHSICNMDIIYGDLVFSDDFSIIDMSNAFESIKKESGVTIHGILGSKFFEKYGYVLDFKKLIAQIK